jgi:hypothetical protein
MSKVMSELDQLLEKENTAETQIILEDTKQFLTQRSISIE